MKILYYVGTASNKWGGLEKFTIELISSLRKENIEIVVVYVRPIECEKYIESLHALNVKYISLFNDYDYKVQTKFAIGQKLSKVINVEKPDIIHYNFITPISMLVVKFLGFRYTQHVIHTIHCNPKITSMKTKIAYWLVILLSDKIICVSNAIKKTIINFIDTKKVETLYLGVPYFNLQKEKCRQQLHLPQDKVVICNIAYHDYVKGVDVFVKAIDYLKNTLCQNNFCAIQVGGNPFNNSSNYDLVKQLELSDRFSFLGLRNDIDLILTASDIYCQPSRSEGIPLSIMEASIAECPIIATNVGGIPEAAEDNVNALLCDSEDYQTIASNLNRLIINKDLRNKMGKEGLLIAQDKFNISIQTKKLINEYKTLIN